MRSSALACLVLGHMASLGRGLVVRQNDERTQVLKKLQPENTVLYNHGLPDIDDITQGDLGNCWLAAVAASMAWANPTHLVAILHDVGNKGKVEVTLRDFSKNENHTWEITKPTPSNANPKYMRGSLATGGGAAWPYILQEAFYKLAKEAPGTNITVDLDGGKPERAFRALTGSNYPGAPEFRQLFLRSAVQMDYVLDTVSRARFNPTTVSSPDCSGGTTRTICRNEDRLTNNLPTRHSFSVLDSDLLAFPKTVTLRNPWGLVSQDKTWGTPQGGGEGITAGDNGNFTMTFEEFFKTFDSIQQVDAVL